MKKYTYPDNNDFLTNLYISTKTNEKYWVESEKNIFDRIIDIIKHLPKIPNLIDIGCGFGRLFKVFYPYVEKITGIEPDFNRYNVAVQEAKSIDSNKIIIINDYIDCVKEKQYDVAIISHVFQHIPMETIEHTLNVLKQIIPTGGLVFVTTTFTNTQKDIFTLEHLKNKEHFSEIVTKEEFIMRFEENGVLPVRKLSYDTMKKLFDKNEFNIEQMIGYHFNISMINGIPTIKFDEEQNKINKYDDAKDILYILRKK